MSCRSGAALQGETLRMAQSSSESAIGGSREDCPDPAIIDFIVRSGLVPSGVEARLQRLPGGISSDIWLVRAGSTALCVKRALPRLRVAADWRAPIERNTKEAAWIKAVGGLMP